MPTPPVAPGLAAHRSFLSDAMKGRWRSAECAWSKPDIEPDMAAESVTSGRARFAVF